MIIKNENNYKQSWSNFHSINQHVMLLVKISVCRDRHLNKKDVKEKKICQSDNIFKIINEEELATAIASINNYTFYGCISLKAVNVTSSNMSSTGKNAFEKQRIINFFFLFFFSND